MLHKIAMINEPEIIEMKNSNNSTHLQGKTRHAVDDLSWCDRFCCWPATQPRHPVHEYNYDTVRVPRHQSVYHIIHSIGNCDRNWIHISYTSIQVWDIRHYIIDRILYPAPSHLENVSQMSIPDYLRRIAEINCINRIVLRVSPNHFKYLL